MSAWNTSKVTAMDRMFCNSEAFNTDLSNWDVSRVTTMNHMFASALVFNSSKRMLNLVFYAAHVPFSP